MNIVLIDYDRRNMQNFVSKIIFITKVYYERKYAAKCVVSTVDDLYLYVLDGGDRQGFRINFISH